MIIAVDYDGTLFRDGSMNVPLINALRQRQAQGHEVILWTSREGARLREAVNKCAGCGLIFHAVNRNTVTGLRILGHDSRKVYADWYIDDKAIKV